MEFLWEGVMAITPQQFVMYLIGGLLIWLAVKNGIRRDHGKPAIIRRH